MIAYQHRPVRILFIAWLGFVVSAFAAEEKSARPPRDANHPPPANREKDLHDLTARASSTLPRSTGGAPAVRNFIDQYIFDKAHQDGVAIAPLASDADYVRRVHLDVGGRLPSPDQIRAFVKDADPDKRDKLVAAMLATPTKGVTRKPATPYLERWTYFLGDLYRINPLQGRGQSLLREHIYNSLVVDQPYNELARELLTASARSNHYNAPVNFLQRYYVDQPDQSTNNPEDSFDEFAIRSTRIFLGVNLECISCHDGRGHLEKINLFLARHKRADVWRQAAFFGRMHLYRPYGDLWDEFVIADDGKGYNLKSKSVLRPPRYPADIAPRFFLTGESPKPNEDPREALARLVTTDLQFSRCIVNLIWSEMFGTGLVDPPLDWDLDRYGKAPSEGGWKSQTKHAELLDRLAREFQDHKFSIRYMVRFIANSSTYQLSHQYPADWKPEYSAYFVRRMVRRLPAQQIWDAISDATGVGEDLPAGASGAKVKYVQQTVSPGDLPPKLMHVLNAFGFDDRTFSAKNFNFSSIQSSILMNNDLVKAKVRVDAKGRLAELWKAEPRKSNAELVEELFLAALARRPTQQEQAWGERIVAEQHDRGMEDVLWALINKDEFQLNY